MAGFVNSTAAHGGLSINGIVFMTPMSRIMNLQVLHSRGTRGSSIVIPGADGSTSRRRRRAERSYDLEMLVDGRIDSSATPATNPYVQLDTNMAYFDNAVRPPETSEGHGITWTWRNFTTKTGYGFIEEWEVSPHESGAPVNRVAFTLTIPAGRLA